MIAGRYNDYADYVWQNRSYFSDVYDNYREKKCENCKHWNEEFCSLEINSDEIECEDMNKWELAE